MSQRQSAWNKGLIVGQKRAFSLEKIAQIETFLLEAENWHDLALLSFGLDTMFRASDLLATKVWQVKYQNGPVRTLIARKQKKTGQGVNPALTEQTRRYLAKWLEVSGKEAQAFMFTRGKASDAAPISRSHYADIVKAWAESLGTTHRNFPAIQSAAPSPATCTGRARILR